MTLKTKLSVVMHAAERERNSSTARMLDMLISDCSIYQVGKLEAPFTGLPAAEPGYVQVLLFPDPSAPILSEDYYNKLGAKVQLVVPDGTWSQARRIVQRNESLYKMRKVQVAPARTEYRLRRNVREGTLCTAEAVAYALGVLEGREVQENILALFREMSNRILFGRRSSKEYSIRS